MEKINKTVRQVGEDVKKLEDITGKEVEKVTYYESAITSISFHERRKV